MNEQWTAGKSKTTEMSPQPKHLCLEESRQSSAWKEQMGKIGGAAWPKAVHRFFGLTEDAGMKWFLFQGLWHGGMFISGPPETAWKAGNVSAFQGYTAYSTDNRKQPGREWALVRKRLCSYCCPGQRQHRDKQDCHLPQRPRKNLIHFISFLHVLPSNITLIFSNLLIRTELHSFSKSIIYPHPPKNNNSSS